MNREWRNVVDAEIKGVVSRDTVKHKERSDPLLLARLMGQYFLHTVVCRRL